jgi:hypothetical protein
MSAAAPTPASRRRRALWRGLRIAGLLLVLFALSGVLYLQQVGVPGWVREWVVGVLRERGVALSFSRLRLRPDRGLVADQVALALPRQPGAPEVRFEQVILEPDWTALLRRRTLELHTLVLRRGRAVVPLTESNASPENLEVEDITARINLAEANIWRLEEFSARALAATWQIRGVLTNGPALARRPRRPASAAAAPAVPWRDALRRGQRALAALRFAGPPEIRLHFSGDALQADAWTAELLARAEGLNGPWGRGEALQLNARWTPSAAAAGPTLECNAALAAFTSRWGRAGDLRLRVTGAPARAGLPEAPWTWEARAAAFEHEAVRFQQPQLTGRTTRLSPAGALRSTAEFSALEVHTPWAEAARLEGSAVLEHALTASLPARGSARVNLQNPRRGESSARALALDLEWEPAPPETRARAAAVESLPEWGRRLSPWVLRLGGRAAALRTSWLAVDELSLGAHWQFPELGVTNLQARLLDGRLQLTRGRLAVPTREISAELTLDFDLQKLDRLLPRSALNWLAQFQYPAAPRIAAAARVRLPPWDEAGPETGRQWLRTLELQARVDGRDVRYRDLHCTSAGVTITLSNEVLRLRDLELVRPEGRAALGYDLNLRTRDFRWRVDCALDARAAAPVVDDSLPPIVALFEFPTPPHITGEVWGNWNPPKPVDFALRVAATNFTFRGETFDTLSLGLGKTNGVLTFSEVRLTRGAEWLEAPRVEYDLTNRVVTLTSVLSRMDPLVMARCIGAGVAAALEPYRFEQPPLVRGAGTVPVEDTRQAALDLEVEGGPFRYWRFHLTNVTAGVHWRGETVSVTNLAAAFYGGRLSGGLDLDLRSTGGAAFRFQARAAEFDLQALLKDLLPERTNRLEGVTSVSLIVTDAQTADWQSWHGRGQVEMRNGLLWDLPIFGLLSPALNLVVPGLGNSRATAARATFRIQRSVIYTDDLAIEAGPARLQYRGTVDFEGRVDARVVAEVLHRTPIIGPLISLALAPVAKVFEYKITGTLWQPELRPLHVPGFLRPLLNPLGTLQNLVTPSSPPAPPPEPKP